MAAALEEIAARCRRQRVKPPSRATVHNLLDTLPTRVYRVSDLPRPVREALYNLDADAGVPGHQLAFYAFNYGDLAAVSFASGLAWHADRCPSRATGTTRPGSTSMRSAS
jgi:hypothetical protein